MKNVGFFIVQDIIYDEQFIEESRVKVFRSYEAAIDYCTETLMQYEAEPIFEQSEECEEEDEYFKVLVKDKKEKDLWLIIHKGTISI